MAQLVKKHELSKPGVVAVHDPWNPFTDDEIKNLTRGLKRFALVNGGDQLFIYGE